MQFLYICILFFYSQNLSAFKIILEAEKCKLTIKTKSAATASLHSNVFYQCEII